MTEFEPSSLVSLQAPDFDCNESHNKGQFYTLISEARCIKEKMGLERHISVMIIFR